MCQCSGLAAESIIITAEGPIRYPTDGYISRKEFPDIVLRCAI